MEKHGGSVSQPYSWRVAQFLRESLTPLDPENASTFTSSDIMQHLRLLETKKEGVELEARTSAEIVQAIRTCARSLWGRRVGVIVRHLDRMDPC